MKMVKKYLVAIMIVVSMLCSFSEGAEKIKNENKKNFLKAEKKTKTDNSMESKTGSSITTNIQMTTTTNSLPMAGKHMSDEDEEKYELERANAMAEFIF